MSNTKISRKDFLKLGGAGLGAMALGAGLGVAPKNVARAATAGNRPNFLFIVVDQLHSLADLPKGLPLPTFRKMAEEGRNFELYHVHQAPCGPSRSVIYTGQYVQKTGQYTNGPSENAELSDDGPPPVELSEGFPTIGKMLREQGYYTAYKGKWHLSGVDQKAKARATGRLIDMTVGLEPYGFSDYSFDGDHIGLTWAGYGHDGVIAAEASNLLYNFSNGHTQGKPWYLAVNFVNPHDIMFFDAESDPAGTHKPPAFFSPLLPEPQVPLYEKDWGFALPKSFYEDNLSSKPPVQHSTAGTGQLGKLGRGDEAVWKRYQNYYFNCIRDVDRNIKSVLDALERYGLADNTIVVITSDHGERAAAHGMSGKGPDIYKETVRVPFIFRHPDVKKGGATQALAGTSDITPTLLGFTGVSDKERAERYPFLKGVNLSEVVADAKARTDRDKRGILFDYMSPGALAGNRPLPKDPPRMLIRGVFDGRYKFGRYFRVSEHNVPRDWESLLAHNDLELYDTRNDPDELVNLAAKPEAYKDLILTLNAKTNAIIDNEIGKDDGSIYPGPTARYNTLKGA
jgi:arylsulfatase A-like enzyme